MLSFVLLAHVAPDEQLALLGGATAVGGWNLSQAVSLTPSGRNRWTAEVNVSAHGFRYFEYKYVKLKEDHTEEWEHTIFNRNLLSVPFVDFTVDDGAFAKPLPPPPNQLGMRGPPLPRPKGEGLRVVVCGSSVASGWHTAYDHGWAWLLAEQLQSRYQHQTLNVAIHGYTTSLLLADFDRLVKSTNPDVVVIGLSLANEGVSDMAKKPSWRRLASSFKTGIRHLLHEVRDIEAVPILADVYPHGSYTDPLQVELLKDAHDAFLNMSVPVLKWLEDLDDGHGRWRKGFMADPGHPNDLGHAAMFNAINISLFSPARIAAERRAAGLAMDRPK